VVPPAEYYARPIKGSWRTEGGGALINQAIHQVDILRWLGGPVRQLFAVWQLGAVHRIESEDVVNAVVEYASGATGVIQAATAFRPGYPERIEIHGSRGTAVITGDKLTTWDVEDDSGDPAPVAKSGCLRRFRPDGDFARSLRAPVSGFRRRHPAGPKTACSRRGRLPGARSSRRRLSFLPLRTKSCVVAGYPWSRFRFWFSLD
jgi:predicted dehydrogenase